MWTMFNCDKKEESEKTKITQLCIWFLALDSFTSDNSVIQGNVKVLHLADYILYLFFLANKTFNAVSSRDFSLL